MSYRFSDKISGVKPSAIREIFKVLADPSVISLAGGNPSPDTFPAREMEEISTELFRTKAGEALQYGQTEGYPPLRELTGKRLREKYATGTENDELIITTGGQQVIDLVTKVLVNEGDVVICEEPSFIGALNTFRTYNARLAGVPLMDDGMDLSALENVLKTEPKARLIYVIPTFQNPTGITTSLEKRKGILALAEKYDKIILEDNPYFELRYSGDPVPAIKSLDTTGRVVYAGSFSKILSPGMRLGYACGPKEIISKLVVAKQVCDVLSNQMFQMIVAEYLARYDLDEHIQRDIIPLYTRKRDLMLSYLERELKGLVKFTRPDGGLFIWCELPAGTDSKDFIARLTEKKIAVVPGFAFMADESAPSSGFRLNFSMPPDDKIEAAMAVLCQTAREVIQ